MKNYKLILGLLWLVFSCAPSVAVDDPVVYQHEYVRDYEEGDLLVWEYKVREKGKESLERTYILNTESMNVVTLYEISKFEGTDDSFDIRFTDVPSEEGLFLLLSLYLNSQKGQERGEGDYEPYVKGDFVSLSAGRFHAEFKTWAPESLPFWKGTVVRGKESLAKALIKAMDSKYVTFTIRREGREVGSTEILTQSQKKYIKDTAEAYLKKIK